MADVRLTIEPQVARISLEPTATTGQAADVVVRLLQVVQWIASTPARLVVIDLRLAGQDEESGAGPAQRYAGGMFESDPAGLQAVAKELAALQGLVLCVTRSAQLACLGGLLGGVDVLVLPRRPPARSGSGVGRPAAPRWGAGWGSGAHSRLVATAFPLAAPPRGVKPAVALEVWDEAELDSGLQAVENLLLLGGAEPARLKTWLRPLSLQAAP